MKKPTMDGMVGRVSARGHAGHCDAYRWLIERHDQILQMLSDHKPSWRVVADALAEEGVTGARGQRLTGERLRQMWQRVSRDKAKAATAGGPVDPQRERRRPLPAGWTPPRADPPPPARSRQADPPPLAPDDYRPQDDETLPDDVREAFRNLEADLRYRDRHLHHPARED